MKPQFGYSLLDGAYGDKPATTLGIVKKFTNTYVAWAQYGYSKNQTEMDNPDLWRSRMALCVDRVCRQTNMGIYLGLFGQRPENITTDAINAILKLMAPYWDRVVAVDIADEPTWDKLETKENLKKVRGLIGTAKLKAKPLGITYTPDQSVTGDAITIPCKKDGKPKGCDFVNLELYTDYHHPDQGQVKNLEYVTSNIRHAWARIDPAMRCWYWMQGFNRNGLFTDEGNLAALQRQTYKLVKNDARTDGITIFNWGRHNSATSWGTSHLPQVLAEHKLIGADLGTSS